MSEQQNFANHARIVPAFHYFLIPLLLFNLAASVYSVYFVARHGNGAEVIDRPVCKHSLAVDELARHWAKDARIVRAVWRSDCDHPRQGF